LLWREVRQLALELASACLLQAPERFGDAKVEDARDAVATNQNVLRRYVAVDDLERLAAA
jgi:hypothetical protein